jgi:hypothetical protein
MIGGLKMARRDHMMNRADLETQIEIANPVLYP